MKGLAIWTVYESPTDHPGKFVARLWQGVEPTSEIMITEDLGTLRMVLQRQGLYRLPANAFDDPVIVETWF